MTDEEDKKLLSEFSSRHGAGVRLVLSLKDDIARWMEEGFSMHAIYRLLKKKCIATVSYQTFRRSIKKVFNSSDKASVKTQEVEAKERQHKNIQRQRPHEMQRQQPQKFVTMTGVDHIGLDKKD